MYSGPDSKLNPNPGAKLNTKNFSKDSRDVAVIR